MIARQNDDERFPDKNPVDEIRVSLLWPEEGRVQLPCGETIGELRRMLAGDRDLDLGQFLAKNLHRGRQPLRLAPAEEPQRQGPFLGVSSAPSARCGSFDLRQRQPGVIEKHLARSGQFDTARAASHELGSDLGLQLAHLTAQRRLRRVQPALGCDRDALILGHGDEKPEMPQLHDLSIPWRYGSQTYKVFFSGASSTQILANRTRSGASAYMAAAATRALGIPMKDWIHE